MTLHLSGVDQETGKHFRQKIEQNISWAQNISLYGGFFFGALFTMSMHQVYY